MAARATFEWLVEQYWPHPDPDSRKLIENHRHHLLSIRNENERERFVQDLMSRLHDMKKRKPA